MKQIVPLCGLVAMAAVTVSCTTLENRRDLYAPQKVMGPYTKMLKHGIPKPDPTPAEVPPGAVSDGKSVIR